MIIAVIILLFIGLVWFSFASESEDRDSLDEKRGWRVQFSGDGIRYEEKIDSTWIGICFKQDGIEPGNYYYHEPTEAEWIKALPRLSIGREEITARVKSTFPRHKITK
jgi:hypothetical protein